MLSENIVEGKEIFDVKGSAKVADFVITDASYLFYSGARIEIIEKLLSLCKNITKMSSMFQNNFNITNVDLSGLDTKNVIDMEHLFYNCNKLTNINFTNFNTSNVANMSSMFGNCISLTGIDLSNFDTKNVTDISDMFNNCSKLIEIDLSNFDFSKVIAPYGFVNYCSKLEIIKSFKNLGKGYTRTATNYSNYKFNLSYCPLTHESLVDIITNGLYDLNLTYKVANGGTLYTQTLQLGSTNTAKLEATEEGRQALALAASKRLDCFVERRKIWN